MNNLNFYRDATKEMCMNKGWDKSSLETVWLLFTEEVGELASAIRQYNNTYKKLELRSKKGTDVMTEMGDVFSYLFQLAGILNIDLDEMWNNNSTKLKAKKYSNRVR